MAPPSGQLVDLDERGTRALSGHFDLVPGDGGQPIERPIVMSERGLSRPGWTANDDQRRGHRFRHRASL